MNEQDFAFRVRRALDDSAEGLPSRVTSRLAAARREALVRMPVPQARREVRLTLVGALAGAGSGFSEGGDMVPLWKRITLSVLPLLIVVIGLAAISVWNDTANADETVDIDAAMLTDDVPISAYTDRGFGVYLKNIRQ